MGNNEEQLLARLRRTRYECVLLLVSMLRKGYSYIKANIVPPRGFSMPNTIPCPLLGLRREASEKVTANVASPRLRRSVVAIPISTSSAGGNENPRLLAVNVAAAEDEGIVIWGRLEIPDQLMWLEPIADEDTALIELNSRKKNDGFVQKPASRTLLPTGGAGANNMCK
jgi:hypothetical protein